MSSAEKRTVSGFEKFVFTVTRVFALCSVAVIVIAIVVLAMKLLSPEESTTVTYEEVAKEMAGSSGDFESDAESYSSTVSASAVAIPEDLIPYFHEENEQVLRNWMSILSEDQQKDFLKNMSHIVRDANAKNANVTDAINTYQSLKFTKLRDSEGFEQYAAMATKAGYITAIFGLVLIMSVLSLVLVMLAIERNTRPIST